MSWSPELYIGSLRPWPNAVVVMRGISGEMQRYVPERVCVPHGEWKRISQTQEVRRMVCDCGYELGMDERGSMPFNYTRFFKMPRYCPNCGCRITSSGKVVEE